MPVKQTQEQTFYFSWQFKEEDKDKNTVVTQKIEGVKLTINVAGNPISRSSTFCSRTFSIKWVAPMKRGPRSPKFRASATWPVWKR